MARHHLIDHLFPDLAEKLTSSYPCIGLECKEPTKYFQVQETEKRVAIVTLVARCCQKPNPLQSVLHSWNL